MCRGEVRLCISAVGAGKRKFVLVSMLHCVGFWCSSACSVLRQWAAVTEERMVQSEWLVWWASSTPSCCEHLIATKSIDDPPQTSHLLHVPSCHSVFYLV
eukprot:scaffold37767_cov17-Tisochrysis_lutea.AAC.4